METINEAEPDLKRSAVGRESSSWRDSVRPYERTHHGKSLFQLISTLIPFFLLGLAHFTSVVILGRDATAQMEGTLAADAVRGVLRLPVRFVQWLFRT